MAIMPWSAVGNKTEAQSDSESVLEEKIGLRFKGLTLLKSFPPSLRYMSGWQVRASGLVLRWPGQKQMTMLNPDKNSNKQAWCQDRILVIKKYSRFLWSVTTSTGKVEPSR